MVLKVALTLAKPVITLIAFFSFVTNWNSCSQHFFGVPSGKPPVQVGLAELSSNVPLRHATSSTSVTISLPAHALATVVSVAPVLPEFPFSQNPPGAHGRRCKGLTCGALPRGDDAGDGASRPDGAGAAPHLHR